MKKNCANCKKVRRDAGGLYCQVMIRDGRTAAATGEMDWCYGWKRKAVRHA
jgi:hypothetical protein